MQRDDGAGEMGVGFLEVVQQPRAITVEFFNEVIGQRDRLLDPCLCAVADVARVNFARPVRHAVFFFFFFFFF